LMLQDKNGWSPLHAAAAAVNPDLVKQMLEMGCDVNAKDIKGVTPLMALFRSTLRSEKLMEIGKQNVRQVIQILMEAGTDINARDSIDGKSVIHLIAAMRNSGLIRTFAEKYKMDIHARY